MSCVHEGYMKVICFDLDDTLYKEIDYLSAAYQVISKAVFGDEWDVYYAQMLKWYEAGEDVFQNACDLVPGLEKASLLQMYRCDVHELTLPAEVEEVLSSLQSGGARLGIITDGRSVTQRNKIEALGLKKYFADEDIIISEEFGSEKPSPANYEYFMRLYPDASGFMYVGDNLKKDFIAPNALGWETVCLLDDGRNIHKQDFDAVTDEMRARKVVRELRRLG